MNRRTLALAAAVGIGAALRLRGLDWGLPWALHIDERLFVVAKAIRLERSLAGEGIPDPGIRSYGILPLWLLVLARRLFLGVVSGTGPPTYGDAFAGTVLLARWISALWGIATIPLVAAWARRWSGATALAAAAMVAGFPALVQASHFGTVEAPLLALIAGGMLAAERLAEKPGLGRAAAAGALLGLALSVKAAGGALLLPLLHAARGGEGRAGLGAFLARGAALLLAALAVVVLLNPALLLAPGGGARGGEHTTLLGNLRRAYSGDFHDWTLPYAHDRPVWTELTRVLPYAIGFLPMAAALAGLAVAARRRRGCDARLLLLLAPVFLLVLPARVKTVRFLLPALPGLAILAAEFLRRAAAARRVVGRAFAMAVVALALLRGMAFSSVYVQPDPRLAAAEWLDRHAGVREIVVVEDPPGYGPPIGSPSPEIRRPRLRYELLWEGFYAVHERRTEAQRRDYLARILARADILVLSEGHRAEFTAAPELRPVESGFYADLDAGRLPFRKVAEFKTYPRIGPFVLRDDRAEVLMRVFDHPRIEIWRRTGEGSA